MYKQLKRSFKICIVLKSLLTDPQSDRLKSSVWDVFTILVLSVSLEEDVCISMTPEGFNIYSPLPVSSY